MSYILDALKKSERERTQRQADATHAGDYARANVPHRYGRPAARALLIIAGLLVFVSLVWLWPRQPQVLEQTPLAVLPPAAKQAPVTKLAQPMAVLNQPTAARSVGQLNYNELPFVWELKAVPAHLTTMAVTIHVYSANQAQQILFINNHKVAQGERTPDGVKVERIVAQGVILSYQGEYFKLPRPR